MGLFDKKYCDFCGNKIGLLGNRKFEDGNMCKDCASKLSPWFDGRRHSTKADLTAQLESREANRQAVAAFRTTRSLGKYVKLLIDDDNRKFMVTSASRLSEANPDVFDFGQATGCDLDISESRTELKQKDAEGKSVSYNPPRYEYSYNFNATIRVDHPYVDDMKFSVSNGYIKTGEHRMTAPAGGMSGGYSGGWNVHTTVTDGVRLNDYYQAMNLGNEIKAAVEDMRRVARGEAPVGTSASAPGAASVPAPGAAAAAAASAAGAAPAAPVKIVCPHCGAPTFPDANNCCEYCGSRIS